MLRQFEDLADFLHSLGWTCGRPPDMIDTIEPLSADRIDQGVRAIEAPELVALLVGRQIPLGVFGAIEAHPIDRLRRADVAVSINTDDPVLLGASLAGEYALCSQAFGWSDEDVRALARNSINASFANAGVKATLLKALARW